MVSSSPSFRLFSPSKGVVGMIYWDGMIGIYSFLTHPVDWSINGRSMVDQWLMVDVDQKRESRVLRNT